MTHKLILERGLGLLAMALFFGVLVPAQGRAQAVKLEAQLVWGTDTATQANPSHKPVEEDVQKKLAELPLKYSHYYEINRKAFTIDQSGSSKVELSDKCYVEVKNLKDSKVEVVLFGKGKEVVKRTQALPKGEMLVLAGNAPNATAWLVTLKRIE